MAIAGVEVYPYGLRQIRIVSANGSEVVDLPAAQTLKFMERVTSAELRGNDKVVVAMSFVDAVEVEFDTGGYPLDAIALMTGRTMTDAGSGTTETTTMSINAGDVYPYFKLYGKSLGDAGDDVHVKLGKVKLTGSVEGEFKDQAFVVTKMKGIALDDGTGKIADVVRNETATTLPSS